MRTMPSVMAKLKKVAGKSTPKNAVEIVSKKAGGVLMVKSSQGKRPHYVKLSKSNRCNAFFL